MILKIVFLLIGFIVVFGGMVYIHELTHQQINDIYGVDSKMAFLSKDCPNDALACTYSVGNYTLSKEAEISLNQTQSINEILGYNMAIPLALLFCLVFFVVAKDE